MTVDDSTDHTRLRRLLSVYGKPDPKCVGKLPKPTKRDNQKGRCNECGGWHGLPAVHLDYVGHSEITRILIEEDPLWSWEPFALDERGGPLVTNRGGTVEMWIRLTVHGKTMLGVGTASADKPEVSKELIGDALRNAAMRFGIALSLWSKEEWDDEPDLARVTDEQMMSKASAKQRLMKLLGERMSEIEARGRAAVLWENHAPKGDGPFTEVELAGVFAAASTPEDAA